ncbi:hypothetical protein U9M48_031106 [Paspalum notatum var. saurae]|uniref:Uncharacterized protein n=1 Tax=Paspalum notatum var. saurae TaxID=547442 RepID=A0AAQ3U2H5_PASNO
MGIKAAGRLRCLSSVAAAARSWLKPWVLHATTMVQLTAVGNTWAPECSKAWEAAVAATATRLLMPEPIVEKAALPPKNRWRKSSGGGALRCGIMALTVHAAAWHRRKGWSNQRQTMHGVNTGVQPGGAYVSVLCGAAVTQRNNSRWCGSPVENLKELLEVETRAPLQQPHFNGKEIQNTKKLNVVEVQLSGIDIPWLLMTRSRGRLNP